MNMREVPSYYVSHVNSASLELRIGSIFCGKIRTHQLAINLSEFIAKQVLHQPGLYSKQEQSVRTLWLDTEMMYPIMKLTVPSAYVYHPTLGPTSKTHSFFLSEICTVTSLPASCGKDHLKMLIGFGWEKYRIQNFFLFFENKDCSCRCKWTQHNRLGLFQDFDFCWCP